MTLEKARAVKERIYTDYKDAAESAMICLDEGFESSMTVIDASKRLAAVLPYIKSYRAAEQGTEAALACDCIFPNEDSLLRLIGSVLMERNSICQVQKAVFSDKTYQRLIGSDIRQKLHLIAEEQASLLAA